MMCLCFLFHPSMNDFHTRISRANRKTTRKLFFFVVEFRILLSYRVDRFMSARTVKRISFHNTGEKPGITNFRCSSSVKNNSKDLKFSPNTCS